MNGTSDESLLAPQVYDNLGPSRMTKFHMNDIKESVVSLTSSTLPDDVSVSTQNDVGNLQPSIVGDRIVDIYNGSGNLQISVVEGRNFSLNGEEHAFRPSVELQIGEHKVRTDTLKDTLSPSWLADFNLSVPFDNSQLFVSLIDSDNLLDDEVFIGRATVSISDLLCNGTRVQWIQLKDVKDNDVGEVCLVLKYSTHQAPSSSTGASTSSESKDDNQCGLKALLCPRDTPSSSTKLKTKCLVGDEAINGIAQSALQNHNMVQGMFEKNHFRTFLPESVPQVEDIVMPMGPSTLRSPVLQMKSFLQEFDDPSGLGPHRSANGPGGKEMGDGGSGPHNGQHKMVVFAGALVAVLVAMVWGSRFCKKKSENQEKKGSRRHD